jgi:hypothetical protein
MSTNTETGAMGILADIRAGAIALRLGAEARTAAADEDATRRLAAAGF